MSTATTALRSPFYVMGGTLARDAASYVVRAADDVLFSALKESQFCYVLTARQMGKSSLMVRTASRLHGDTGVVVLDLTAIGQNLTAEQWYDGLLARVGEQLELEPELEAFWNSNRRLGPLQRWMAAWRQVVLPQHPEPVVVFIDEIDTVRSLPFSTDEFFAGIREFYNRRTQEPELTRLTFCLLGVATASDLIRDTRTTPFNIGKRIELHDFTPEEATPLAQGFPTVGASGEVLERILYWTGGHPYLTQRLCHAIAEHGVSQVAAVDQACAELFFSPRAEERDDNLLFVRQRLLRSEVDVAALLVLYRQIWRGRKIVDDETNPLISVLRLSGIVRANEGRLRVRNRIYAQVFNNKWIRGHMPDAELRRQRAAYVKGMVRASAIAATVVIGVALLAVWAFRQRDRAEAEARRAEEHRQGAMSHAQAAALAASVADVRRREAETQRQEADAQREEADTQRREADSQRVRAQEQELRNRHLLYVSDMKVANQAWIDANPDRVETLLARHTPKSGEGDPRGFEWFYLWRSIRHGLARFRYDGPATTIAFTPDNTGLVIAGNKRTVEVRDVSSGSVIRTIPAAHEAVVRPVVATIERQVFPAIALSGSGKTLAAAFKDGWIRLWSLQTGDPAGEFRAHNTRDTAFPIAFSSDGTLLAVGAMGLVDVWDVQERRPLKTLGSLPVGVTVLAFSPDGRRLVATAGGNGMIYQTHAMIWDVPSGALLHRLDGHKNIIIDVEFSPHGSIVATSSADHTVRLWDAASGKQIGLINHQDVVTSVAFSSDGRRLATACGDRVIRVYDNISGSSPSPSMTLKGHSKSAGAVAFSPDGRLLASADDDGVVRIWDAAAVDASFAPHNFFPNTSLRKAVMLSDDNTVVAVDAVDQLIVQSREPRSLIALLQRQSGPALAASPDGRIVATAGHRDRQIKLWSTRDWKPVRTISADANDVAFSSDGRQLASAGQDGKIRLWNPEDEQRRAVTLHDGTIPLKAVVFGANHRLAAADENGAVIIWDVRALRPLAKFSAAAAALVFSPDGELLATAGGDGRIRVWSGRDGRPLFILEGHVDGVLSLGFSPDGRRLVSGSLDKSIRLWDLTSREELIAFHGHTTQVVSLQFSSTGRTLMSAGPLGRIRFWDTASTKEVERHVSSPLRDRASSGRAAQHHSQQQHPDGRR